MTKQQITYNADNWTGEVHSAMLKNEGGLLTMAILDGGRYVFTPNGRDKHVGDFQSIDVIEEATLFEALDAGDDPEPLFTVGRFDHDPQSWEAHYGDLSRSASCPFEAAGRLIANL